MAGSPPWSGPQTALAADITIIASIIITNQVMLIIRTVTIDIINSTITIVIIIIIIIIIIIVRGAASGRD